MISRPLRLTMLLLLTCPLSSVLPWRTAVAQEPGAASRAKAERSTTLTVTVNGASLQLSPEGVSKLPQTSVTVHNGHTNRDEHYTGVLVSSLLQQAGLLFSKGTQSTLLRSYVRAQGTDFYFVIYSGSEVEPELNAATTLVATQVDGKDLGADGRFKLISTSDKRPARWVRNLTSLTLTTLN